MIDTPDPAALGRELIAFHLGNQEFCVDIMSVREIRGWTPATPLPRAPACVLGVINLRGVILPIVDLGARLGFAPAEPTARHAIIVAQVQDQVLGLLVNGVSDILTVPAEMIQAAPDLGPDTVASFVRGLLSIDGRMVSDIALDHVLADGELQNAA